MRMHIWDKVVKNGPIHPWFTLELPYPLLEKLC